MLKPSRFLDPKTDIVFKKIFDCNIGLIKSFLNSLLPLPEPIDTLEYLTSEQSPRIPTLINAIFDKETDEWFHHYKTINIKDHAKILGGLELIFLELPKFKPQTWKEEREKSVKRYYRPA